MFVCVCVWVCNELNMEAALGSSEHCSIHRPVGETKLTQQKQQIFNILRPFASGRQDPLRRNH